MYLLICILTVLSSVAVGWSIGANDAANSLGTAVGSKVVTLKQGIILITIFGFLGAVLQGKYVVATIGKGIVPIHALPSNVGGLVAMIATIAACLWVVLATYWKMPISTSHSIVGAVAGAGLAVNGITTRAHELVAAPVNWSVMRDIFLCWVLTPLGAALIGYVFYLTLRAVFPKIVPEKIQKPVLTFLIIASGCYVAFSWGANDVANAIGLIAGAGILSPMACLVIGGLSIALGIVTWGYKVIETIGSEITRLLPLMAFSAQLASGVNVHAYTLLGVPVSTSHSIVGAIFGVGLVLGVKVVNLKVLREIVVCWIATPFVSGILSFALLWVVTRIGLI